MCGIAGFIAATPEGRLHELIRAMTDAVAHRGPDGAGTFVDGRVALGHRRLAIIDLSELGAQPMTDPDTGRVIVYNGEIYNYVEVRQDLVSRGVVFRSHSDTEVILKAYDAWGDECVTRFNGMWAFAIYDPAKRLVFCSRDRFGVKPFYYVDLARGFAFGSEIRQLLPLLDRIAADTSTLAGFLCNRVAEREEATFFDKVRKLPGGHNLTFDLESGKASIRRHYRLEPRQVQGAMSADEAASQFRSLLEDAIRLRLRSDVRVGTCLSGGLDSSSIAVIAARLYSRSSSAAFSAITAVSEDERTDESDFARAVVEAAELDWITLKPGYEDFREALGEVVTAQEEPFAAASVAMQFFVMRAARRAGIPVLLDGQGGDEALLGYERYFADYCLDLLRRGQAGKCLGFLRGLRRNGRPGAFRSLLWNLAYFHGGTLASLARRAQQPLLRLQFQATTAAAGVSARRDGDLFSMQRMEVERTNLPVLLRYEDKNSMWHSIETRLPFLDYRVMELSLSLEADLKLREGWSKYVLRRAMQSELPEQIAWRRNKFGFEAPESRWMAHHAAEVRAAVQSSDLLAEVCRSETLTDDAIQQMQPGRRWRLFSVARWSHRFGVSALA